MSSKRKRQTTMTMFERAPLAYHELDLDGRIRRVNHAECLLLGYSEEELLGTPIWDLIAGADARDSKVALAEKYAGTRPLKPFRRTYVAKSGEHLDVEIYDQFLRDDSGALTGMRSALVDITARTTSHAAVEEDHRWLAGAIQSLEDAILVVDALGRIKVLNEGVEALTGRTRQELLGRDIQQARVFESVWLGEGIEPTFQLALLQKVSGTANVCRSNGTTIEVLLRSAPIMENLGKYSSGIVIQLRPSLTKWDVKAAD